MLTREQMAARVARELPKGALVAVDPTWADAIRAQLPQGVQLVEAQHSEVDVAVVAPASISVAGEFAGEPNAKTVIALLSTHRTDDGAPRITPASESPRAKAQRLLTNLALFDVTPDGLVMREVVQGVSALEVQLATETPLLAHDGLALMRV